MKKNQNNKRKFCCANMTYNSWVQSYLRPTEFSRSHSIVYDPVEREFYCYYIEKDKVLNDIVLQNISYCPFCGTKLPKALDYEYIAELEKAIGREAYESLFYYKEDGAFKEVPILDRNRVPEEFKTDEWWIKRGL